MLFTVREVFFGQAGSQPEKDPSRTSILGEHHSHHHNVPSGPAVMGGISETNHMSTHRSPMLKINYCHSCGYRQAYEDIRDRLKIEYPELDIKGETNRPGFLRSQIANIIFLSKIAFFVMIYARFDPFAHFQLATPRMWHLISENRMAASVMVLLLASSIESNMMSTGAFEIFFNDMPVWSKIQQGRLPSYPELSQAIGYHLSLDNKSILRRRLEDHLSQS